MKLLVFRKFSKITGKQLYWDHQMEFLKDVETRNLALVCGYGAGKTYAFLKKTLYHLINSPTDESVEDVRLGKRSYSQSAGWVVYPTLELALNVFLDPFLNLLKSLNIKYRYIAHRHRIVTSYGFIDLKTMDRPEKLISENLSFCGVDEFDVLSTAKAMIVYEKLISRMRARAKSQLYFVTTPEGFRATHKIFEEQKDRGSKRLIRGRTVDNLALPKEFIDDQLDQFDEVHRKAYMDGLFVNMKYQSAYKFFDRELHTAKDKIEINPSLPIILCFDFNVEPSCVAICQDESVFNRDKRQNSIREKGIKIIDEIVLKGKKSNTYQVVEEIKAKLPRNHLILLYGDATGNSHKSAATSTDWEIIEQGLESYCGEVKNEVKKSNPPIDHRVSTVNYHLRKNNIIINKQCKTLINDFEQVSYKENGQFDTSNKMLTHMSDAVGYYLYKKFSIYNRKYD